MDKLQEGIATAEEIATVEDGASVDVESMIERETVYAEVEESYNAGEEYLRTIAEHITGNERPLTAAGWIGVNLLMLIPPVNLLFLFLWAGGGTQRTNLKNYARGILLTGVLLSLCFLVAVVVSEAVGSPIPVLGSLSLRSGMYFVRT